MPVEITLDNFTPATVPADGWIVGYRILGTVGAYTIAGPFFTLPILISTGDPDGTLYEGYVIRDCGSLESIQYFWQTPCSCTWIGSEYVVSITGDQCQLDETQDPTLTNSGYCLATSQNAVYTSYESRIYTSSYNNTTLNLAPATVDAGVYADLTSSYWANLGSSSTLGPLNREGVWIDSNCDGVKNALGSGVQTTVAYVFNNLGSTRTIYVGIGADNQFKLKVNGTEVADSGSLGDVQFKIWHIIPITVVPGSNYINAIATGDGSVNDAIGLVVYDNTAAEIAAATSDLDLSISFASHNLRGTSFDVATCPSGWSLDTSGGAGNYICRRTTYAICNGIPV